MHHHVYLLWDLLQSSHGEIRVVACIGRLSELLAGKKLIAVIICIRRAAFSVILAEFVQIVPEQFSHDNQMFLVDKKELKTQSNAMQVSEDLAIEQSTQIKYRGSVSESDNFLSGDQPCDRSGRKGLVNRSTGHIANNISAITPWFCAVLCFAMLQCFTESLAQNVVLIHVPIAIDVLQEFDFIKRLVEKVLCSQRSSTRKTCWSQFYYSFVIILYSILRHTMWSLFHEKSASANMPRSLSHEKTRLSPIYCFLSIRQWFDWEVSQTWSNLATRLLFFNTRCIVR